MVVTARERTPDGRWWYACQAILPGRSDHPDGRTEPVAVPTDVWVPAESITAIPGEDYSGLPSRGAVAGRQWVVQPLRRYAGRPVRRLHRRDCWQAGSGCERVTAERARELLGAEGTEVCDVCRPDRALS